MSKLPDRRPPRNLKKEPIGNMQFPDPEKYGRDTELYKSIRRNILELSKVFPQGGGYYRVALDFAVNLKPGKLGDFSRLPFASVDGSVSGKFGKATVYDLLLAAISCAVVCWWKLDILRSSMLESKDVSEYVSSRAEEIRSDANAANKRLEEILENGILTYHVERKSRGGVTSDSDPLILVRNPRLPIKRDVVATSKQEEVLEDEIEDQSSNNEQMAEGS
ncbi:MAG TPA: hypothetical protein VMW36_04890 [Patescibacteria group bacterium]|nr:hypothetical protein [Patescibacteria group bacterium]